MDEADAIHSSVGDEHAVVSRDLPELCTATGLRSLTRVKGLGGKKALILAERVGSVDRLNALSPADLRTLVGKTAADALRAQPLDLRPTELPSGVWVTGYYDADYPEMFKSIPDPPPLLWGRGRLPAAPCVAVVGSRDATDWSRRTARLVAESAVREGFAVVSGLAVGVDTAAHEACLDVDGVTVAILGNGVDRPYPAANRELADRIVDSGGCVIAEVPPGTKVIGHALVARDRLQSGLSRGTVIVQTGIPGGTLHTARFTIEQSRLLVVAMPNSVRVRAGEPGPYAGNVALTDPEGCDSTVLGARGSTISLLAKRRPVADMILRSATDLPALWDRLRRTSPDPGGQVDDDEPVQSGRIRS